METAELEIKNNGTRPVTRRRTTYSARQREYYRQSAAGEKHGFFEMILAQSMVSGVILLSALVISMVDIPFCRQLKVDLKNAFMSEMSINGVLATTRQATEKVVDIQNSVNTIFGKTPVVEENVLDVPVNRLEPDAEVMTPEVTTPEQSVVPEIEDRPVESGEDALRIDEDILESIDIRVDNYAAQEKKTQIPVETMPTN